MQPRWQSQNTLCQPGVSTAAFCSPRPTAPQGERPSCWKDMAEARPWPEQSLPSWPRKGRAGGILQPCREQSPAAKWFRLQAWGQPGTEPCPAAPGPWQPPHCAPQQQPPRQLSTALSQQTKPCTPQVGRRAQLPCQPREITALGWREAELWQDHGRAQCGPQGPPAEQELLETPWPVTKKVTSPGMRRGMSPKACSCHLSLSLSQSRAETKMSQEIKPGVTNMRWQ